MLRRIRKWFGAQSDPGSSNKVMASRNPETKKHGVGLPPARAKSPRTRSGSVPPLSENVAFQAESATNDLVLDTELRLVEDVDSLGPGKNVLPKKPLYSIESGTYETLQVLDLPAREEPVEGMDPYNTGGFDKSDNWDKPLRK